MNAKKIIKLYIFAIFFILNVSLTALTINLIPDSGLEGNPDALAAFRRAANKWEQLITDPIVVSINAGYSVIGSSTTLGQTSAVLLSAGYYTIANALYQDSLNEQDDSVLGYLPTTAPTFILPSGFSYSGNITGTKANLKALGFSGLDSIFGITDATITMNSNFNFDFDANDGITGVDFENVVTHELAHALGFISATDNLDIALNSGAISGTVSASILDIFRFNENNLPESYNAFTTTTRDLRPGEATAFSDVDSTYSMSTGQFKGDGRQASHWKDNELTGETIGVLDPTLGYGQTHVLSYADLRALDLMGYDIVPEPSSIILLVLGIFLIKKRKKNL